VRGPDLLWGGDIREFHPPTGRFDGVIGGSPCQDFSSLRRDEPTGYGLAMLAEFARVVTEAAPDWFLLENVARVPDIHVPGYTVQRLDLDATECGLKQSRLRHFQYGDRNGFVIIVEGRATKPRTAEEPCCTATEGRRVNRRGFTDFCELQGLPSDFDLPGMTKAAKYKAVGNGVPIPMARMVARAVKNARAPVGFRVCDCGCGRPVYGHQQSAGPACRKRLERKRHDAAEHVTAPGTDTGGVTLRTITMPLFVTELSCESAAGSQHV
jgi:DNA (cytosine-5)-methyltransferase 1